MRSKKKLHVRSRIHEQKISRLCDVQECEKPARHRAPHSRKHLDKYYWFCLEHVREYNASWNYYKGMNEREVEKALYDEPLGERYTRPFSSIDKGTFRTREQEILESLRQFMYFRAYRAKRKRHSTAPRDETPRHLRDPLKTLGLTWPITFTQLRSRYYDLVKVYHPDRKRNHYQNNPNQEFIKEVNTAFASIKNYLRQSR